MFGIVKKDCFFYLLAIFVIMPLVLLAEGIACKNISPAILLLMNGFLIHIYLLGPVIIVEQQEDKDTGYAFLSRLPLLKTEIAAAKLFNPVCAYLVITCAHIGFLELIKLNDTEARLFSSILAYNAMLGIIIVELLYFGIFLLGLNRCVKMGATLLIFVNVVPLVLIQAKVIDVEKLGQFLKRLCLDSHWAVVLCACAVIYLLFLPVSTALLPREH